MTYHKITQLNNKESQIQIICFRIDIQFNLQIFPISTLTTKMEFLPARTWGNGRIILVVSINKILENCGQKAPKITTEMLEIIKRNKSNMSIK